MPLNGFPPIKKFNIKNVKINSVRVKMKIIILIESQFRWSWYILSRSRIVKKF